MKVICVRFEGVGVLLDDGMRFTKSKFVIVPSDNALSVKLLISDSMDWHVSFVTHFAHQANRKKVFLFTKVILLQHGIIT